jgi:hypothetical protein
LSFLCTFFSLVKLHHLVDKDFVPLFSLKLVKMNSTSNFLC